MNGFRSIFSMCTQWIFSKIKYKKDKRKNKEIFLHSAYVQLEMGFGYQGSDLFIHLFGRF